MKVMVLTGAGKCDFRDIKKPEPSARVAKSEDFPACVDFVQRGIVDLAPIISNTIKFNNMGEALEFLDNSDGRTMKIIMDHAA